MCGYVGMKGFNGWVWGKWVMRPTKVWELFLYVYFYVGGKVWSGWVMDVLIPREGSDLIFLQDSYDNSSELLFNAALLTWDNAARVYNIDD